MKPSNYPASNNKKINLNCLFTTALLIDKCLCTRNLSDDAQAKFRDMIPLSLNKISCLNRTDDSITNFSSSCIDDLFNNV